MDHVPVTLTVTVGQINFLVSQLLERPYKDVAQSIAYLQGEAQKAINAEQARQAEAAKQPNLALVPESAPVTDVEAS